jgi:polyhydroxyalkanoate synthase
MHSFYLRNMYQENKLVRPGGICLKDTPIDLRQIKTPAFLLSTQEDHIAPWKSTYAATRLYGGPVRFCLAGSGHIAGVINPPDSAKYGYYLNTKLPKSPDQWLDGAEFHKGSWWEGWDKWVGRHGGGQVPARAPGTGIENAPGSYVQARLQ